MRCGEPNRASYPSCASGTPKLRLALYPEQAWIAESQSHERVGNERPWLVCLPVRADRLLGVQGRLLVQSSPADPHLQPSVLRALRSRHGRCCCELDTEGDARAIEATLKRELAEFRAESPAWVPLEAGGQTEWFSAVQFGRAEQRLRSFLAEHEAAHVTDAAEYVRAELERLSGSIRAVGMGPGAAGVRRRRRPLTG